MCARSVPVPVVGMCLHFLQLHAVTSFVCLEDEFVMIRFCGVVQPCMPCVGMCSSFSTAGSWVCLQTEKWQELLALLTGSEALCIAWFLHFSHCHFCIPMPTVFPEVLESVELSQSQSCKSLCSRMSIQRVKMTISST